LFIHWNLPANVYPTIVVHHCTGTAASWISGGSKLAGFTSNSAETTKVQAPIGPANNVMTISFQGSYYLFRNVGLDVDHATLWVNPP
jgi:hypothetical protein